MRRRSQMPRRRKAVKVRRAFTPEEYEKMSRRRKEAQNLMLLIGEGLHSLLDIYDGDTPQQALAKFERRIKSHFGHELKWPTTGPLAPPAATPTATSQMPNASGSVVEQWNETIRRIQDGDTHGKG